MIHILEDDHNRIKLFKLQLEEFKTFANPFDCLDSILDNLDKHSSHILFLDHDLECFEYTPYKVEITGTDFVNSFVSNNKIIDRKDSFIIFIHSHNVVRAKRMFEILSENGFTVELAKFGSKECAKACAFAAKEIKNEHR